MSVVSFALAVVFIIVGKLYLQRENPPGTEGVKQYSNQRYWSQQILQKYAVQLGDQEQRAIPCQVIQQNWNFSSDPHQNSRNFIKGKISGFSAQRSWHFWNWTCISKVMSIWNLFIKRIGPRNSWSFAVGTSTDCHSFISEYFHSIFCSKVEGSMLNKTTQTVFHWWPLNRG